MNPLIKEAAASVQMGWLLGVMTVVFFVVFLGWVWWAYNPRNRERMEEAAMMPFMDGGEG
ncbi:MAG: cbb3-type cytochrome oxidase subunit 3 [Gemmatimonadota bacterium]